MTQDEIIEKKNTLYSEKMDLENCLNDDDYKTIKNYEAQAVGEQYPYDPVELHQKHQAWRDRINAIEDEIDYLNSLTPDDESNQESEQV